ncbi:MAG: choice-of-anchor Q domain-containing protein [Lysobacterales bacterium]
MKQRMSKMKRTLVLILMGVFSVLIADALHAKTFYVDTFSDSFAIDGHCSLREALAAANGATLVDEACGFGDPGKDVINLPPGIYSLFTPFNGMDEGWGDLDVHSEVEFNAWLGNVTIRQEQDVNGQVHGRVLEVWANGVATLKNLTIEGGITSLSVNETWDGGGIRNLGWLLLDHVTVTGNTSVRTGGGILNGGSGVLHVYDSTISGNTATGLGAVGGGGGIVVAGGHTYLHRSTVNDNETSADGGGLKVSEDAWLELVNSTVSGNDAWVSGGGIANRAGTVLLSNVTVTDNTANSDLSPNNDGFAGGVWNDSSGGLVNLWNTLIAKNHQGVNGFAILSPDCAGDLTSHGNNLVGLKSIGCNIIDTGAGGDIIGDPVAIDPLLGPLADNTGSTLTHTLDAGSPAVDAGRALGCLVNGSGYLSEDQRQKVRPSGAACDIGAYEFGYNASRYVVTSTTDDGAGCTLREALESIMGGAPVAGCIDAGATGVDRIEFAPGVTGTIALTANLPTVDQSIHIVGPGSSVLAIDGQGSYRSGLFIDSPGNIATVVIEGLTFTRGFAADEGGALLVYSDEAVELVDVVVEGSNCSAGAVVVAGHVLMTQSTVRDNIGTGLRVSGGSLQMTDSILSGNTSTLSAGGVKVQNSSMTIIGSTFSGNTAGEAGGAMSIVNSSSQTVAIEKSTFAGNTAGWGGAIAIGGGKMSIVDSSIYDNKAIAGHGGGIRSMMFGYTQTISIANSTISGNSATGNGGGVYQDSSAGVFRLANVTITDNTASNAFGVSLNVTEGVIVRNSIIAGNHPTPGESGSELDCGASGSIVSEDYNLLGAGCPFNSWADHDTIGTAPLLGPLGDNGGPTWTHQLLSGSPAIDGANPAGCSWDHDSNPVNRDLRLNSDQRLRDRYYDGDGNSSKLCDIGAVEFDGTVIKEELIFSNGFE